MIAATPITPSAPSCARSPTHAKRDIQATTVLKIGNQDPPETPQRCRPQDANHEAKGCQRPPGGKMTVHPPHLGLS